MSLRITNGINKKTIYITSNKFNNIYFPLNDSISVNVDEFAVNEVTSMIKEYYNKANFVIDARLEYMMLVLDRKFPNYITVFNIYNTTFELLNKYISSPNMFSISEFHLYTSTKEKLIDMYIVIKFMTREVQWKMTTAMNVIEQGTLLDLLLNYLGFDEINKIDIMDKANKLRELVSCNFRNDDHDIKLFNNKNELMNALLLLRDNSVPLKVY